MAQTEALVPPPQASSGQNQGGGGGIFKSLSGIIRMAAFWYFATKFFAPKAPPSNPSLLMSNIFQKGEPMVSFALNLIQCLFCRDFIEHAVIHFLVIWYVFNCVIWLLVITAYSIFQLFYIWYSYHHDTLLNWSMHNFLDRPINAVFLSKDCSTYMNGSMTMNFNFLYCWWCERSWCW